MIQALAPQIARIVIRYLSMGLVTLGLVSPETATIVSADPHLNGLVLTIVGGLLAAIAEASWVRSVAGKK
jgi:Mg/Co/Ni transporter MgtE